MLTQTSQNLRPVELIPVIGYLRVSTWFEEKISDELQKAAIEEATRRRGRTVVKWISDLDATGRNFKRKIMEAIGAVETGAFEGAREIWVWKYSRFGRNRHGVAINLARVEQAGGQLISATEEIDATTATGRFTRGMLFELAAFESDRIGETWRETHDYRRTNGLPATGGPRFGYVWHQREIEEGILKTPEHYEPDEKTADVVRQIYEDYANGDVSLRSLAEGLNKRLIVNPGARTADGWSRPSLTGYLDTGFPAGLLHVHRSDISCPIRAKCTAGAHYGYIPGAQPQILSDELWAAFLEKRDQRMRMPPRARIATYPFSGIAKCGLCGSAAVAFSGSAGQRGIGWRCTRKYGEQSRYSDCPGASVRSGLIEEAVRCWLEKAAAEVDRRVAGSVVVPKQPSRSADVRAKERLGADLAKVQKGLDRASMAHAMGDMPRDSYLRIRDELTAKRDKLDAELALAAESERADSATVWETRRAVVRTLVEEWATLAVPRKRDLLASALVEIRLFPPDAERRVVPVPREGFVF